MNSAVAAETSATPAPRQSRAFLTSVLWNWFGIGVVLFSAFILSPFIIRKLGDDNYGLWSLTLSLVEYYWLVDFGLRSATLRYTAHYTALGQPERVTEIVNTNLAYSVLMAPLLVGATWFGSPWLVRVMNITHPLFSELLLIVIVSWAITSVLSVFTTALEGLQRFDIINQSSFVSVLLRSAMTFGLLLAGRNIIELAWVTAFAQVLLHVINCFQFRRVFPTFRFSLSLARIKVFRELLSYGVHSLVASLGQRLLNQSPPLIIGYMMPTRFVGYYSAPRRLLEWMAEGVTRIGNVSNCRAAELAANHQYKELTELSIMVNRYSLLLFLPLAIFFGVYGHELLAVWISPSFAAQAAGVMMALLPGITIAISGQFNSTSILFGIGRHQICSRLLLIEAILSMGLMAAGLRWGGLETGAAACSALMILNRGLITPWLLTRELEITYPRFLTQTFLPLLTVAPVAAVLYVGKSVIPGKNWPELIAAGTLTMAVYVPLAWFMVRPADRTRLLALIGSKFQALTARRAA